MRAFSFCARSYAASRTLCDRSTTVTRVRHPSTKPRRSVAKNFTVRLSLRRSIRTGSRQRCIRRFGEGLFGARIRACYTANRVRNQTQRRSHIKPISDEHEVHRDPKFLGAPAVLREHRKEVRPVLFVKVVREHVIVHLRAERKRKVAMRALRERTVLVALMVHPTPLPANTPLASPRLRYPRRRVTSAASAPLADSST
jgi:hypothetical protein